MRTKKLRKTVSRVSNKVLTSRLRILLVVFFFISLPGAAAESPPEKSAPLPTLHDTLMTISDQSLSLETKTPEYVILQPIDEATFSSETTASVAKLNVKEGSYFQSGDILVELDCRVQKADHEKAIAQQIATDMGLKSAVKLQSYDAISQYEVVKAQSESKAANAEVEKLSAILDKCVIVAPFNGAVSEIMVHTHETVKPGDPLLRIVNTDNLIVQLEVPSDWLQWLHIDSTFDVHLNEINKSITAKIIRINPVIEPVSQTVKIVGMIIPTADKLLPGMSGQAIFPENPAKKKGGS